MTVRAPDPGKYALNLMDVLFTDEEMRSSCFISLKRTKKTGLDEKELLYLKACTSDNRSKPI